MFAGGDGVVRVEYIREPARDRLGAHLQNAAWTSQEIGWRKKKRDLGL